MVRLLIQMRAAMARHRRLNRFAVVSIIGVALAGLVSAVSSLLVGLAPYPTISVGASVVSIVVALWVAGRLAYAAFSGGSGLRLELFRLLPIPRRVLARGLLVSGLADASLVVMALAFGALVVLGAGGGVGPALVGFVGALETVLLTGVLVAIVEAAMPPASRQRQATGTVLVAVVISAVAVVGTLLPTLASALVGGRLTVLQTVSDVLPTGWAGDAVAAASIGDPVWTALPLMGLALLIGGCAAVWPAVLGRRLEGSASTTARRRVVRRRLLPSTPSGGVASKELRMWVRDPLRLAFLVIAAIVGVGVCAVPVFAQGTTFLLPFVGILAIVIAGAGGSNLYGSDGLTLRLTMLTPGAEGADIRGRQMAFLLITGPLALIATIAATTISGEAWAWPWALGGVFAIIGGAAGLVPLASVTAVLPLEANGGPSPAWPVKVYATMLLILVSAAPTAAVLLIGALTGSLAVQWAAVPVGAVSGVLAIWALGRVATDRLRRRGVDIVAALTAASERTTA